MYLEPRPLLCPPFDARQEALQPQMACHVFDPEAEPQAQTRREPLGSARDKQAGKALARKLSPRVEWWRVGESNPRPLPCEGSALPTELTPR